MRVLLLTMSRPRRSNLSQQSRNAISLRDIAIQPTEEEPEEHRVSMARLCASQTQQQREAASETARLAMRNRRPYRTDQQRDNRRRARRNASSVDSNRAAFLYDHTIDYSLHPFVRIGSIDVVCEHCGTMKFAGEAPGFCCLNGKAKLPLLIPSPEPLHSLLLGETLESHFLANTQKYNGCFQTTSFGADIIEEHGFNPTFKIQGQIHHRIGLLQPLEGAQHKFSQIYFMGNMEEPLDRRQEINTTMKRAILQDLQQLLHEHHA